MSGKMDCENRFSSSGLCLIARIPRAIMLAGLFFAACELLPWAKKDLNFTPAAQQTPGSQELADFIRSLKRGKTEKASGLLSEEARVRWNLRLALMPDGERKEFLRDVKSDTFLIDEDVNRFVIKGKSTAPTRAKIVRERGKRRLEF